MSSSDDDYEHFSVGTIVVPGNEENTKSPKSPSASVARSPSLSRGIKVLPATKPRKTSGDGSSPGLPPKNYCLTQPPKVKSKVYSKKTETTPTPSKAIPTSPKATPSVAKSPVAPPVLGPKPKRDLPSTPKLQPQQSTHVPTEKELEDIDANVYEQMDAKIVSGEMSLTEFTKNFSHTFPQQIVVSKGNYGEDDDTTLSSSDVCNIHSLKKRTLVQVEEKGAKQSYNIPINSAIKFAPVFNHRENLEEISKGERFPYVSNLLDLVIMPKVVCACQPYDANPVDVGDMKEILAIKEVIHPESAAQGRKLRVYSFSDHCDKVLDESAYGDFSTRPSDCKLYMSDILKHVMSPFPMHVLMFKDVKLTKMLGLPQSLYTYPLLMTKKFTEVILIATSAHANPQTPEPFEIPTEIDIDIQLMKLPEPEHQQLVKRTEKLQEKLESVDVKIYRYQNMSDEMFRAQTKLYQLVRVEGKEEGTDGPRPTGGVKRSLVQRIEKLERASDKYVENQTRLKEEKEANEKFCQLMKDKLAEQEKVINNQATELKLAMKQIATLRHQLKELSRSVHGIDNEVESDLAEDDDPRPEDAQGDNELSIPVTNEADKAGQNKKQLAKMNKNEVVKLLYRLQLGQYESSFLKENINGELLIECDDNVLQNELGIKSKLHRLKIMRVIQGLVDI